MSIWDYFVAELKCPACGAVTPADGSTGMLTYIGGFDAYHRPLRVGDDLDVAGELPEDWDYLPLATPAPGEPVHLLEIFRCPTCGTRSFAEVVIRDGIFESITPAAISRPLLDRVHGVTRRLGDVYPRLTGVALDEDGVVRSDWLARLRDALPEDGSAWTPPAQP